MPEKATKKKRWMVINTPFLLYSVIAFIAGFICYTKGKGVFLNGLDTSLSMLIQVVPRMVVAFLLTGFAQVLIPKDLISRWLGEESGLKGVAIASLAGMLTPGGPMTSFPLVSALYALGADYGTLVAYITSWEVLGIQRLLVWEIPFMGNKFVLLRVTVSLFFPIISGITAKKLTRYFSNSLKAKRGQ